MIDDELYPLVDWSAGGIAIRSEQQSYRIGDRKKLELEIDLDDYAVNLDLEGEVVNRSSERTGWQFIAPTETQLEVLRALTRASLTGESFAAPFAASADPRSGASGLRSGSNPITAGLALALNLVIIALAAGAAVYHLSDGRMPGDLVAALTPAPAVRSDFAAVAVERLPLEADVAGAVVEWRAAPGDAVRAGEPLLVLLDEPAEQAPAAPETPAADVAEAPTTPGATTEDSGDATGDGTDAPEAVRTILTSPCDCTVLERSVEAGERVVAGETVGILTPETGTRVEALFATAAAPRPGDAVAVELPASGERLAGIVEEVNPSGEADATSLPRALLGADETVIARIRPTPALSPFLAGAPAIVTLAPDA